MEKFLIVFPLLKGPVSYGLSSLSTLLNGKPSKGNCALHLAHLILHPSLKFPKELTVQKKNKNPRGCLSRAESSSVNPWTPPSPPNAIAFVLMGILLPLAQKPLVHCPLSTEKKTWALVMLSSSLPFPA